MTVAILTLPIALMLAPADPIVTSDMCGPNEKEVFSGAVEDDFGLDVAVCLSGDASQEARQLTIRWQGEGGGDEVTCEALHCDGVIEYSRYTRPRLTIVQLAWTKGAAVQKIYQTLDATDSARPPQQTTQHSWVSVGSDPATAETYPVMTDHGELALMALEGVLPARDWSKPLLSSGVADRAANTGGR